MGFGFHAPEVIALVVIALVIFGPKRLPEIGGALGKSIQEFKKSTTHDDKTDVQSSVQLPPAQSSDVHVPEKPVEVTTVSTDREHQ